MRDVHFSSYMAATFPGLSLGPPLFYRWPVGIRFELGVEGLGIPYDDVVMNRARALYETVFQPGNLGLLVSAQVRYESLTRGGVRVRYRRHRPNVFQLSRRYSLGLHGSAGRKIRISNDDDTREITTYRWTEVTPRGIDYPFILKAKANAELYSRRPATDDRLYFINQSRNIILHMYDDRGMDLIAANLSDLRSIYEEHKGWILDYDRKQIEATFA